MKWLDILAVAGLTVAQRFAAPLLGGLIALMADAGLLDGALTDGLAAVLSGW